MQLPTGSVVGSQGKNRAQMIVMAKRPCDRSTTPRDREIPGGITYHVQ